ncbi:MAG: cysteine--tRNA ligase [Candidatus Omnitrophota bacterium]
MIKLYNTLTRTKEEFKPIVKGKVGMYVCGPTVYDVPHIGHIRSSYVFDVVRKYFEHVGFKVCLVKNVTDIDDKIIKKAADELEKNGDVTFPDSMKEKTNEVAARYLDVYHREMERFGISPPDVEPMATENIPNMIKFIETLIKKENAYVSGGNVYFSVEKSGDYGKLSNQAKDEMQHAVRTEPDKRKRYPLDFVLWKSAKTPEPSWPSPWGEGRPGWHVECSVMSTGALGVSFDIHGGGLDLVFPHHENEIAQAEAATGKTFAHYWMHNGLLTADGEKMSKSLNNYVSVSDFMDKYGDPDLLKMVFLTSHYRSSVNYSDEKISEAAASKKRIMIFLDKTTGMKPSAGAAPKDLDILRKKFNDAMDDDFNTPTAVSVMFDAVRMGNECLSDTDVSSSEKTRIIGAIRELIMDEARILGLSLTTVRVDKSRAAEIEKLVSEREAARKAGQYTKADDIRRKLAEGGISIEDTPGGTVWRKS